MKKIFSATKKYLDTIQIMPSTPTITIPDNIQSPPSRFSMFKKNIWIGLTFVGGFSLGYLTAIKLSDRKTCQRL